eukprot:5461730-Lingulodinium_polyedra.AAC.1
MGLRVTEQPRACAIKTRLNAPQRLDAWRDAKVHNPLGPAMAARVGKCLGVWLAAAAAGALREAHRWERATLEAVA